MDYKVMGYGIEEYGVEWGYEIDEDGNKTLCVSDASNRSYDVASEDEAIAMCENIIAEWKEDI